MLIPFYVYKKSSYARKSDTYDMSEIKAKSELWRDSVHEVEHVGHALLVLVLQMAVVEVLLDAPTCLSHFVIFLVHHDLSGKETAHRKRVLTLHHKLSSTSLGNHHERCAFWVCHRAVAAALHLNGCFEFTWFSVRELPLKTGHQVLSKWYRELKDEAVIWTISLAAHSHAP